jgi:transmembrane sensor
VRTPSAARISEAAQDPSRHVTPRIAAEAAVWVARLHGPERSPALERDCLAWQARSQAHRLAFERCTDTWQSVGAVSVNTYASATRPRRPAPKPLVAPRRAVLSSAAVGAAALLGWRLWPDPQAYATGIGERRIVMLSDGSRMTLNTSSDVRAVITAAQRIVNVLHGEALFEVAKDTGRPFVVQAAGLQVKATGTAFLVRSMAESSGADVTSVTLIEGQVVVQRTTAQTPTTPMVMAPGQRLRVPRPHAASALNADLAVQLDRPQVDKLVAWQRGEAVFDNTPLADAVAEMNRYSKVQIILAGQAVGALRIGGLHRTGDNESFAHSVAHLHGLKLTTEDGRLTLEMP